MKGNKVTDFTARFAHLCKNHIDNGGTQQEIADMLGVSRQTIGAWATGVRSPKRPTVEAIAQRFNVSLAWLNGFDVDMEEDRNTNGDLMALREQLRRQPGMRVLFDASKNATEQDLLDAAALLEGFKKRRDGDE